MANANLEVKKRLQQAAMSGDKEGMRACLAPDFVIYQSKGHPYGGTFNGAEGFITFMGKMMGAYAIESLEAAGTFWSEDPDHAVFEFKMRGKCNASGLPFETILLEHWAFRDSKVLSVRPCWFEIPR